MPETDEKGIFFPLISAVEQKHVEYMLYEL